MLNPDKATININIRPLKVYQFASSHDRTKKSIYFGSQVRFLFFEQAIRFVVMDRAMTQGTRSIKGQEWSERIWTVMATTAQQGR